MINLAMWFVARRMQKFRVVARGARESFKQSLVVLLGLKEQNAEKMECGGLAHEVSEGKARTRKELDQTIQAILWQRIWLYFACVQKLSERFQDLTLGGGMVIIHCLLGFMRIKAGGAQAPVIVKDLNS